MPQYAPQAYWGATNGTQLAQNLQPLSQNRASAASASTVKTVTVAGFALGAADGRYRTVMLTYADVCYLYADVC